MAFMAAGKSKEHTDKGKEEKLELLQSFFNAALHFTVWITLYLLWRIAEDCKRYNNEENEMHCSYQACHSAG